MAFDSLAYLVLLTLTAVTFFAVGQRARLIVLIAASLAFYAAWSVPLVSLIVVSAGVDFFVGRYLGSEEDGRRRRAALLVSLVVNLGLLGYFKYAGFFLENVHAMLGVEEAPVLDVLLPPGISFYTFQTMSYTIDVYRRAIRPTTSFLRFFLFVSFFPQLIAGPIERAGRLLVQFDHATSRRFRIENLVSGGQLILWGLFKKVVIADHCGRLADAVYGSPASFDGWSALVATYAFTLQIYCDFSAYSEIARGSARIFGIDLMRNFDQPYLTRNIRDFWRRWHISLSNWFRDYVYIPLGGSRHGRARTLAHLGITMFVSGLWHGAAWNFVLWGLFHGAMLLVHAVAAKPIAAKLPSSASRPFAAASWFMNFHMVVLGWALFRVDALTDVGAILGGFASSLLSVATALPTLSQALFIGLMFAFVGASAIERRLQLLNRIHASPTLSVPFAFALVAAIALFGAEDGPAFIYFQF